MKMKMSENNNQTHFNEIDIKTDNVLPPSQANFYVFANNFRECLFEMTVRTSDEVGNGMTNTFD